MNMELLNKAMKSINSFTAYAALPAAIGGLVAANGWGIYTARFWIIMSGMMFLMIIRDMSLLDEFVEYLKRKVSE